MDEIARYNLIKVSYLSYFPVDDKDNGIFDYSESIWNYWEEAIETIKNKPIKYSEIYDEVTGEKIGTELDDCEYVKSESINNMYGAMVVSLWAFMEKFLSSLSFYLDAIEKRNYDLASKMTKFSFPNFKTKYKRVFGSKLSKIQYYTQINDIRLLNNIFKHCNGTYNAKNQQCNNLSSNLKGILEINDDTFIEDINYESLDMKEYVSYFNKFSEELVNKIDEKLKKMNLI